MGVFGIIGNEKTNVASSVYYGLYALQHRGQESCGIVVNDDGSWKYTEIPYSITVNDVKRVSLAFIKAEIPVIIALTSKSSANISFALGISKKFISQKYS